MSSLEFDPGAPAKPDAGIFGLPHTRADAKIILLPVPFDATTSYRRGTAAGPESIFHASMQVDLFDRRFGRIYERGIYLETADTQVHQWNAEAAELSRPLIDAGGADLADPKHVAALLQIDRISENLNRFVYSRTVQTLDEGKIPGTIGGEHSIPFGAICAVAEKHPGVGILHLDAHLDFRPAYEGFTYSHASIMFNVMNKIDAVSKLVQIGIRDMSEEEMEFGNSQGQRVQTYFDDVWADRLLRGDSFAPLVESALQDLPDKVYVSFDIDVLDPALCPHTGTPVPGGLSFQQAVLVLDFLRQSGRQVVGFDLVEVAPGPPSEPELDANVGARILYKLCGTVTASV